VARGRGYSRYAGMRVTLTQTLGSDQCLVTVSVKGRQDGWDEWTLLFPAIRHHSGPLTSSVDAATAVGEAVEMVLERLHELEP